MVAALLADLFESHRAHLLSVAYRLTGSVRDAEDAVQESWLRLSGARQYEIEDQRAWLTSTVSRICLGHLGSAAARRERSVGPWLPEPVVTGLALSNAPDPLAAAVRKPENRLAAMVVLDTLTPQQRVAFVLHEGLSVPFAEIADILDLPADAVGRYAEQALAVVGRTPKPVSDSEHETAVRRFLDALTAAEVASVVAALHPDSVLMGDANGTSAAVGGVITGPEDIGRYFLELWERYEPESNSGCSYEFGMVNGQLGLVGYEPDEYGQIERPRRIIGFAVCDGLIWGAYDLADPAKLSGARMIRRRSS